MDAKLIHTTALRCFEHASRTNDVTYCARLLNAIPSEALKENYADWFMKRGPLVIKRSDGNFHCKLSPTEDGPRRPFHLKPKELEDVRLLSAETIRDSIKAIEISVARGRPLVITPPDYLSLRTPLPYDISTTTAEELLTMYFRCVERRARGIGDVEKAVGLHAAIVCEWRRRSMSEDERDFFRWPSTTVYGGGGQFPEIDSPDFGMLAALGYRVGRVQGVEEPIRQALLDDIFIIHLPPIDSASYVRRWGTPAKPARLEKMAKTIAALTRNAKGRVMDDLWEAIAAWEGDLEYLRNRYYMPMRCRFSLGA